MFGKNEYRGAYVGTSSHPRRGDKGMNILCFVTLLASMLVCASSMSRATDHFGDIISDQVWIAEDNPHIVTGTVIVNSEVTLTMMPGVIVRFNANKSMIVNGTLKAIGTESDNIYFTSAKDTLGGSPNDGDWTQILFSSSVDDSLVWCQIRYGGYLNILPTSRPMIDVSGCSPVFINCTVRDGRYHGLSFGGGAHALLRDCAIYDNMGVAMWADVSAVPVWEGDYGPSHIYNNIFESYPFNGIYIPGGDITSNDTWYSMGYTTEPQYSKYGIPMFIGDENLTIQTSATLRLDPGVRLNFRNHLSLDVNGTLKAIGTSEHPILFTSYQDVTGGSPNDGDWTQILFSSSVDDSLVWCQIRYGGYLNIRDCAIYDNMGVAMWADVSAVPVWEGDYGPSRLFNNVYSGVNYNGIYIPGGTISANTHWQCMGTKAGSNQGIPFYIGDELIIGEFVTLELDAGVTLRFLNGKGITVDGTLNAIGSAGKEVYFISYLDSPTTSQYWKQIKFEAFSSGTMEFCRIKHAGRVSSTNYYALAASNSAPLIQHCTFENCSSGLIQATNAGCPTIHYSSLLTGSTSIYGVNSDCTCTVDARNCFFGDASGPYHPTSNPTGTGSRVSDCVLFSPWWLEPYGTPEIAVYPSKLGASVESESTAEVDLVVINQDPTSVLSYSISEGVPADPYLCAASDADGEGVQIIRNQDRTVALANVSWISVQPTAGLVDPDSSTHVTVTFDSHGMECQPYEAFLIISSNDADEDPIIIPLCMRVYIMEVCADTTTTTPKAFCLGPNYPNPFNPTTTLTYYLPTEGSVKLAIYDIRGGLVKSLVSGVEDPGHHSVVWNGVNELGNQVSSGVYFVRLEALGKAGTRKIVLTR